MLINASFKQVLFWDLGWCGCSPSWLYVYADGTARLGRLKNGGGSHLEKAVVSLERGSYGTFMGGKDSNWAEPHVFMWAACQASFPKPSIR